MCIENADAIIQERRAFRRKSDAATELEHVDKLVRPKLERRRRQAK